MNNIQCGRVINRTFHIWRPKRTEAVFKMISFNVSSYWPEWTAVTPWDVTKSNSLLPLPRAYMLIISTDAPVNSILRRHETRGATCTRAEMILTCVRWILSFLHTLHHRWPLHHTATYSQVRSHLNTSLVIILACQRRLIATGNKFHWHKKTKTHWDTKTRTCKHITEIATVSVDVTLTESFQPSKL